MIIKNANVITPKGILSETDLKISGSRIGKIAKNIDADSDVFDASGLFVCPGFVDIHTHGGYGCDFMDEEDSSFEKVLKFHAMNGTTALLASSVTAPVDSILSMIKRTERFMKKDDIICRVLGAHIEGPYISYKNKGAQKAEYLRVPA
ncbi:MAG: N-acetylglucosamine-6-phosphate deacetylase, partial [Clostridia bacterium]